MKAAPNTARGKFFSASKWLLQRISDTLRDEFKDAVTVSTIQPAAEGDFFIYVTWFEEAAT